MVFLPEYCCNSINDYILIVTQKCFCYSYSSCLVFWTNYINLVVYDEVWQNDAGVIVHFRKEGCFFTVCFFNPGFGKKFREILCWMLLIKTIEQHFCMNLNWRNTVFGCDTDWIFNFLWKFRILNKTANVLF